jgi:hypothetical protein
MYFWRRGKPAMWLKTSAGFALDLDRPHEVFPIDFPDEIVLKYGRCDELTELERQQIREWTKNQEAHF